MSVVLISLFYIINTNLSNFDNHSKTHTLVMLKPFNSEKYMSFSRDNKLFFISSLQFWSSSLDNLVRNLNEI